MNRTDGHTDIRTDATECITVRIRRCNVIVPVLNFKLIFVNALEFFISLTSWNLRESRLRRTKTHQWCVKKPPTLFFWSKYTFCI